MTITQITAQVKNPTRCNIYLDGVFYCGLELETVMRNRLKVGMETEKEFLDKIQAESEVLKALDKALTFISRSKKTEKQVRDYLFGKGYTSVTVAEVLEKMRGYGFLDDEDYAVSYANEFSSKKGKKMIAYELKKRGVGEREIEAALSNVDGQEDAAREIAAKYMKNKERNKVNLQKCYKYLLSKGFDFDVARAATYSGDEDTAF